MFAINGRLNQKYDDQDFGHLTWSVLPNVNTGDSSVKLSNETTFLRWKSHSIEFLISIFEFSRPFLAGKSKFTNKKFNGMGFPSQKGNLI